MSTLRPSDFSPPPLFAFRLGFFIPLFAIVLIQMLFTSDLLSQNPHRQGLWFELGTGPSAIRMNCTGCENVTRATGSGAMLRIGGTLSSKVLLGLETFGFTDESFGLFSEEDESRADLGSLSAVVLWYPWRSHFFIKSGVGLAEGMFTVQPASSDSVVAEGVGVGLTFGLGFDVPISRKIAITANAATFFTAIGDIVLPAQRVEDVIPTTYMISVGLTVR